MVQTVLYILKELFFNPKLHLERKFLSFRLAEGIRRNKAAVTIQKYIRGWLAKLRFQRIRTSVILIQRHARGHLARHMFLNLKYNAKVNTTNIGRFSSFILNRSVLFILGPYNPETYSWLASQKRV